MGVWKRSRHDSVIMRSTLARGQYYIDRFIPLWQLPWQQDCMQMDTPKKGADVARSAAAAAARLLYTSKSFKEPIVTPTSRLAQSHTHIDTHLSSIAALDISIWLAQVHAALLSCHRLPMGSDKEKKEKFRRRLCRCATVASDQATHTHTPYSISWTIV